VIASILLNVDPTMQKKGQIKIMDKIKAKVVVTIARRRKRPTFDRIPSLSPETVPRVTPDVAITLPPVQV
jgi:hypothetical protein